MRTPKDWISELAQAGCGHPAACCCDRCKQGMETFLLENDIAEIQRNAREGMVPAADVQPLLKLLLEREDLKANMHFWNEVRYAEKQLHAKHPNLFTK